MEPCECPAPAHAAAAGFARRRGRRTAAAGVLAGPRMIATDDEVRAAVVLPNDGVPHALAGTAHAHGERQERQERGVERVRGDQRLIAAHPCVVIHVARLRHPDHGVHQQVRLDLLGGPQGQLLMGTVHGVPRLKRHDLAPAHPAKLGSQLGRGVSQRPVIMVRRQLHPFEPPTHIERVALLQQVRHAGVLPVRGAEDAHGLHAAIRLPYVLHVQRREHHAFGVAQGQRGSRPQPLGEI